MSKPANEGTGNQDLSITQQTQNTEQTRNTQQTNLTQQFLALLNQGSADSSAGGFGETQARASARAPISEAGAVGVRFSDGTPRSSQSQQTNTAETASREVNCLPCNGCCGRRRGRRLPGRVYDFVAWVAGVRGVPMCQVVNEFPELFCVGGSGGGRVGVSERGLSRRVQYKAGYLLKMFGEAGEVGQVVDRLVLAVREYLEFAERRRVGVEEARQNVEDLARGLGFSDVRDFALYLWWLVPSRVVRGMEGLIKPDFVGRRGPYVDVLGVRCLLPHEGGRDWQVHTTMSLPRFLHALVTHFRHDHGLTDWRQVAQWVLRKPWRAVAINQVGKEGELGGEDWERLTPSLRLYLFEDVLNKLIDVLVGVGLVEDLGNGEYKCVLDGVVVRGRFDVYRHLHNEHSNLANDVRGLVKSVVGAGVVADEGAE
ncbi:hypothetical protein [Vulcanisaeta sp. EB80]|uniref:hypothetical protein n=1 Tax=Vulcanisaeta sp. EB80 TaxID=1650660 RepID=UPI0011816B6E|nr:hypothetical protein [Vulcanisaeta sp. EB80]